MAYEIDAGKDLISIERILSRYLWNQDEAPYGLELIDDKWIRKAKLSNSREVILENGEKKTIYDECLGDPIYIDAQEYMTHGAGRFVSAADFGFFEKFFAQSLDLSAGNYDFQTIWNKVQPESLRFYDDVKLKELKRDHLIKSISQYDIAPESSDFVTRAFIFGTTGFTFDTDCIKFVVNADGSKEIQGLKIIPCEDNFDFEGGGLESRYI